MRKSNAGGWATTGNHRQRGRAAAQAKSCPRRTRRTAQVFAIINEFSFSALPLRFSLYFAMPASCERLRPLLTPLGVTRDSLSRPGIIALTDDFSEIEVVATNFNWRQSGGTTAVVQLVPEQAKTLNIAALGFDLPDQVPRMRWRDVPKLLARPVNRPFRIYHCRRNNEMMLGILLRHVLRAPLRLIFNSAGQRRHKALTRWMLRRMDAVIATSERSGSFLEVPYTVVPHGINFEYFHPPRGSEDDYAASGLPGKYAIGCTGRIRHQKGTDLFVAAMLRLLPHYPDWTAVIAGRTTSDNLNFERELKSRIAASGLTQRIVFLGDVDDIALWYRRFRLFVAP